MAHDPRVLGGGDLLAAVCKEAEARVKRQVKGGERRATVGDYTTIRSRCLATGELLERRRDEPVAGADIGRTRKDE